MKKLLTTLAVQAVVCTSVFAQCSGYFNDSGQNLGSSNSVGVASADLDGDGDIDAFVTNSAGQANRVWLNDGSGAFTGGNSLGTGDSWNVDLADLDGDGDVDAFVCNGNSTTSNTVWLNDGNAGFIVGQSMPLLGSLDSYGVALGDLDGDGDADAFVANGGFSFAAQANKVWLNDSTGNFTDNGQSLGPYTSYGVALADLDNDGDLDAFVANGGISSRGNRVWLNDSLGNFTGNGQSLGTNVSFGVVLADFDNDGDVDAFVVNGGANKVYLNDGAANFTVSGQSLGSSNSYDAGIGDIDQDGDVDVFAIGVSANKVWLNDGAASFTDNTQTLVNSTGYGGTMNDLDGDGDPDAFIANYGQANKVWINGMGITTGSTLSTCNNQCDGTGTVTVAGGVSPFTYLWDDPGTQNTATAAGLCAGTYTIAVTDSSGCLLTDTVVVDAIQIATVDICLTTVDSTSSKNEIVWEKPVANNIDSFFIYRESTTNNYQRVGAVAYNQLSRFIDTTNGVNPNVTSYRYKLSVLDSCGNESPLSDHHKTMHIIVSKDINNDPVIQWDDYEGFVVNSYRILRDTTGAYDWGLLGTVAFGINSYTDLSPPMIPFNRYILEVVPPDTCTASKMGTDYNTTRSNNTSINTQPLAIATSSTDATMGNCDGTATASVVGGTAPYAFLWDDPGAQTDSIAIGLCPGTYTVLVTDDAGDTLSASVVINEIMTGNAPVADFMGNSTSIAVGSTVDFLDLSNNSPNGWTWIFDDATPSFSTDQNPTGITYNTVGTYDVTLVATNAFGVDTLVKTDYIEVTSGVGIGETGANNSLLIFPNPFTNATTMVFENEEQVAYELILYDVLGNQVRVMENITTNEVLIEKGHLTPGVYFIALQGNGTELRGKLMVE